MVLIKMDLKNAFGSVHSSSVASRLYDKLSRMSKSSASIGDAYTALEATRRGIVKHMLRNVDTIAEALCYEHALPVGFPTSPLLFNLVMGQTDARILGLLRRLTETETELYAFPGRSEPYLPDYFRYVDDITVVCHREHGWVKNVIKRIVESEGFVVSKRKTRVMPFESGWSALGMAPGSSLFYAPKKLRRKMRHLAWRRDKLGDAKAEASLEGMIASIPRREFRAYLSKLYRRNTDVRVTELASR